MPPPWNSVPVTVTSYSITPAKPTPSSTRIIGDGDVTVEAGTTILSAVNTYTGDTLINGGTLLVNGSTNSLEPHGRPSGRHTRWHGYGRQRICRRPCDARARHNGQHRHADHRWLADAVQLQHLRREDRQRGQRRQGRRHWRRQSRRHVESDADDVDRRDIDVHRPVIREWHHRQLRCSVSHTAGLGDPHPLEHCRQRRDRDARPRHPRKRIAGKCFAQCKVRRGCDRQKPRGRAQRQVLR